MAYIDSTFANNLNFESTLVPVKINLCLRVKVSYLRLHNKISWPWNHLMELEKNQNCLPLNFYEDFGSPSLMSELCPTMYT